jgi:hypothetical protein
MRTLTYHGRRDVRVDNVPDPTTATAPRRCSARCAMAPVSSVHESATTTTSTLARRPTARAARRNDRMHESMVVCSSRAGTTTSDWPLRDRGRGPTGGGRAGAQPDPSVALSLEPTAGSSRRLLHGVKSFCGGAGIVDRALVTVRGDAGPLLVEVDLVANRDRIGIDHSRWITPAFVGAQISVVEFDKIEIDDDHVVGPAGWYLDRPGFWASGLLGWCLRTGGLLGRRRAGSVRHRAHPGPGARRRRAS